PFWLKFGGGRPPARPRPFCASRRALALPSDARHHQREGVQPPGRRSDGKGAFFWDLGNSGGTLELLTISVTSQSRVSEVKGRIQEACGTPTGQQRLLMSGCPMEDGRTMASYGMNDEGEVAGLSLCLHMTPTA
ncbi:unnamed protein product, partial [Prorocentrum cordatum]